MAMAASEADDEAANFVYEEGKFFGCYLLTSLNDRYKGRTYIGFTVNPNRRILQHNSGYGKGGAKRTSGKGPWEMILIVHGFPNEISALRFEWAWQNPEKSIRLKHLVNSAAKGKQYSVQFKFSILCEMLRMGPWTRLPLMIRWLKQEFQLDFPLSKLPPTHMPIVYGLVKLTTKKKLNKKQRLAASQSAGATEPCSSSQSQSQVAMSDCFICGSSIDQIEFRLMRAKNILTCVSCLHCKTVSHTKCLAECFLNQSGDQAASQLLPIEGECPQCEGHLMWGDLVKHNNFGDCSNKRMDSIEEDEDSEAAALNTQEQSSFTEDEDEDEDDGNNALAQFEYD